MWRRSSFRAERRFSVALALLPGAACGGQTSDDLSHESAGDAAHDGSVKHPDAAVKDATVTLDSSTRDVSVRDVVVDAPLVLSCTADPETDPRNCGACGHDCLGQACESGMCKPVVIANVGDKGVGGFAIDGVSLYWTETFSGVPTGSVEKCPLSGCIGAPTTLATGQAAPEPIWVVGADLYWNNENGDGATIMKCSVDCNNDPTPFYQWPNDGQTGFAANSASAFVIATPSTIVECPTSGCSAPVTFASGQPTPGQPVLTDAAVYWTNRGPLVGNFMGVPEYGDGGGILSCPLRGCSDAAAMLVSTSIVGLLTIANGSAYWLQDDGSLVMCALSGCNGAPTTVIPASAIPTLYAYAVDETGVYVEVGADVSWEIWRYPLAVSSQAAERLYSETSTAGSAPGVLLDATHAYFVSGDGSEILAIPK